jgi:nucleotide-binding universal stress UspA family protein
MMEYPKYKQVLFCTDFSENSDQAFEYAYGIARRDEGTLYILHVIPMNPHQEYVNIYLDSNTSEKIQKEIEKELDRYYIEHYVNKMEEGVTFEIVTRSGREDEEILKFAQETHVDLIVIGTHGRTGIEHVFFGSVAEKILRNSPFPVYIIPCKKKAECL